MIDDNGLKPRDYIADISHLELFDRIINNREKYGITLDKSTPLSEEELHNKAIEALTNNDMSLVKHYIKEGVDINKSTSQIMQYADILERKEITDFFKILCK